MKRRRRVYCEYRFLRDFLSSRPDILEPSDDSISLMDNWVSMYSFICKSDLVIDISTAEFQAEREKSPWLAMLWKKAVGGECGLQFEKEAFPKIEELRVRDTDNEILNAVFLADLQTSECKRLSELFGVIVINVELSKNCFHLFGDNGTAFPSEHAESWDFMTPLLGLFPPINVCNTMMIVDNYILTSTRKFPYEDKVKYNLRPIMDHLLPQSLTPGEVFQIVIFSECYNLDEQYAFIKSTISKIRPKLQFALTIFSNCRRAFHDRSIVTNNLWLSCGHGFDVFKRNGTVRKSTNVSIVFPFVQSHIAWADNSFLNLLIDAQSVYSRLNDNTNSRGNVDKLNRICAYYCEEKRPQATRKPAFVLGDAKDVAGIKIVGKIDLSRFGSGRR
ncbi:hypothetical protein [Falsiporphyromonas endometrii]|uniref:Uncharacterized protein n=1 Tax=Falsiporphyromonas endometrii TaxID=1387297 RepID=A0ABV9KAG1_9PORP